MAASCSLGMRMYCRKAELCHFPRVWIVESSMPARAAEVAAPMRKLCPAYSSCGRPREERTARTCCTNHDFVTGDPCAVMKKGPARSCRSSMYDTTAVTEQMGMSVRPTITSTPLPNWLHFDRFKWTFTTEGYVLLSTATSPTRGAQHGHTGLVPQPGAPPAGRTRRRPDSLLPISAVYLCVKRP